MNGASRSIANGSVGSSKCGRRGTISTIGSTYSWVQTRLRGSARGGRATIAASSRPCSTLLAKSLDWPANSFLEPRVSLFFSDHSASANAPISVDTSAPITTVPDSESAVAPADQFLVAQHQFLDARIRAAPGGVQHHRAAAAIEQRLLQALLERAHLQADRCRAQADLAAGGGKGAVTNHGQARFSACGSTTCKKFSLSGAVSILLHWANPHNAAMANNLRVRVWRGGADGGFSTYEVPRQASQTVLDVVTHIQRRLEPSLGYRFSCRVGMCGSCAMTVNGVARWTCRTHVSKVVDGDSLEIAPLANLPVVKDLATDMGEFFDKWARAKAAFAARRRATRHSRASGPTRPDVSRPTPASSASAAVCAMRRATWSRGAPTISARRR